MIIQYSSTATGEPMHTASKQWHCALQLYQLSSETLCCQLCLTCYTAVQINNCLNNQSSPYENYRLYLFQMEAITCLLQNQHFSR